MKMTADVLDVGLIEYRRAWELQKKFVCDVIDGADAKIIICEHPAVLTRGRLSGTSNILCSQDLLSKEGIEVIDIERGGDITLHAPGQLVVYPVMNLSNYKKDLKYYLWSLEEIIIKTLAEFDITGRRSTLNTGVWINRQKIASLGISCKKWVAFHGLGLNVNTDLNLFSMINPCGLNVEMTSMQKILKNRINLNQVKSVLLGYLLKQFNLEERILNATGNYSS